MFNRLLPLRHLIDVSINFRERRLVFQTENPGNQPQQSNEQRTNASARAPSSYHFPSTFLSVTSGRIRGLLSGRGGSKSTLTGQLFSWLGQRVMGKSYTEVVPSTPLAQPVVKLPPKETKETPKVVGKKDGLTKKKAGMKEEEEHVHEEEEKKAA